MSKPLTKQAFLEGKPFYKADDGEYSIITKRFFKYDKSEKSTIPDIREYLSYEEKDRWRHHVNIAKIADDCFFVYTSICAQSVDKKIYYHEYNLVEDEPADGTN